MMFSSKIEDVKYELVILGRRSRQESRKDQTILIFVLSELPALLVRVARARPKRHCVLAEIRNHPAHDAR